MPCLHCGHCCQSIPLSASPEKLAETLAEFPNDPNAQFITQHWTHDAETDRWTCDCLDAETGHCKVHKNGKPPVCRDYPYYGRRYIPKGRLSPDCGYRRKREREAA